MKAYIDFILKLVVFPLVLLAVLYILEYGFVFASWDKLLYPFLLSGFSAIILFKATFKRYLLFLSLVCLALMVFGNIFNLSNIFNNFGNFGFSLLLVTIALYIPQLIKKGHIERF